MLAYFFTFLKGLLMGTADIIPGVSGGTIALITGIYERLVDGINYIVDMLNPKKWKDCLKNLKGIDYALFIPLFLGIGIAFLSLAQVIHILLEDFAAYTYAFFFGLIIASAAILFKKLKRFDLLVFLYLVLGILAGVNIVALGQANVSHSLPVLFASGAVAITAMILPGISGSFILLLLNQYEYVIGLVKNFVVSELAVFGAGAVVGILLFAKVLHYLIHKFRNRTFSFLIGLMIGSLRLPAIIIKSEQASMAGILILGIVGLAVVFLIEALVQKK